MSWLRRVRNKISPIQMKRGSAVRVQLDADPQMVMAIASPAGLAENICMPTQATPESVRPIHTPLPKIKNKVRTKSPVIIMSFMAGHSLRSDSLLPRAWR